MTTATPAIVLGVHLSARGISWIAFSGPLSPYDWGTFATRGSNRDQKSLSQIERVFARYNPEVVVFENMTLAIPRRSTRISNLRHAIEALAHDCSADVTSYSKNDIEACFAEVGASTRHEIAEAIGRHIPALSALVPKRRKPGQSERSNVGLFCAAALVLTHYHVTAFALLHQLRKWAEFANQRNAKGSG